MATKDFEVQQLLRAHRKGLISDELLAQQMTELGASENGASMPNVFSHRGNGAKVSAHTLGKTAQSETMVFSLPAHFGNDHENSHRGDQIIYVIEGRATARVSGKECEIKAGDLVTIPAGAPHTLRTGDDSLFALTIFAPPEPAMG
jgi:quercetin dioxygenase-like cupin family protein